MREKAEEKIKKELNESQSQLAAVQHEVALLTSHLSVNEQQNNGEARLVEESRIHLLDQVCIYMCVLLYACVHVCILCVSLIHSCTFMLFFTYMCHRLFECCSTLCAYAFCKCCMYVLVRNCIMTSACICYCLFVCIKYFLPSEQFFYPFLFSMFCHFQVKSLQVILQQKEATLKSIVLENNDHSHRLQQQMVTLETQVKDLYSEVQCSKARINELCSVIEHKEQEMVKQVELTDSLQARLAKVDAESRKVLLAYEQAVVQVG